MSTNTLPSHTISLSARRRPAVRARRRLVGLCLAAVVATGTLGACGSTDSADEAGDETVTASNAWVRATPAGSDVSAAYMTVTNTGTKATEIVAASVPADIATETQLHTMGGGDMGGMREVESIEVPGDGSVELEPGGLHIMLIGVRKPLEAGTTVPVTIELKGGGGFTVDAEVRAS